MDILIKLRKQDVPRLADAIQELNDSLPAHLDRVTWSGLDFGHDQKQIVVIDGLSEIGQLFTLGSIAGMKTASEEMNKALDKV